jgi:hypothetical protein
MKGSKMKKLSTLIKILIGLAISGTGLLALILFMSGTSPLRPGNALAGYPTLVDTGTTPEPFNMEDALSATQIAKKLRYTPSAMELATAAVDEQMKRKVLTLPPIIDHSYPINSVEDLAQVIYNSSFRENDEFMSCIRAKSPGTSIFLQSIDKSPDYYMIPFFKNNQLCALAIVRWKDGLGHFYSIMSADRFTFVEVSEAIARVEQISGKKVTGTPILVQGEFEEAFSPFRPFWKVTTSDGQIYYVITRLGGQIEANTTIETIVTVVKAEDMHPLD